MSSARPSPFSHLLGNGKAKEILERLLEHRCVPTTLLFHGPSGIGKGLFALSLAHCLVGQIKEQHPDIHIVYPDPKTDQHPIASIRQILEEAALLPFEAPVKLFIIHDAEKMLASSSNALLKTLEEPPPHTYFILLSSDIDALLPTIVSRCNKIPFFPVPEEELGEFLTQKFHIPPGDRGHKIAVLAQGSVAEAIDRISHPIDFHLAPLFQSRSYTELHGHLAKIQEPADETFSKETNHLFEEILHYIRETDPLRLEEAIFLIGQARHSLHHHIKLKNVLENFYLSFLQL